MENTLKAIMEKLESMEQKFDKFESTMQEDIAAIKQEQMEFRIETRVNFNNVDRKFETVSAEIKGLAESMTEEIEALVVTHGKIEQRVTILDNRYKKDTTKVNEG